jgi:hypothetical protein
MEFESAKSAQSCMSPCCPAPGETLLFISTGRLASATVQKKVKYWRLTRANPQKCIQAVEKAK